MIDLAVFDWNGTILSDLKITIESTNKELAVLGLPPIDSKNYLEIAEVPIINFYKKLGVSAESFNKNSYKIARAFHEHYEPLAARSRTRPGSRACLAYLRRQGIKCVVLSNHTIEGIYLQLERLKLASYFQAVLANDELNTSHFNGKQQRLHDYISAESISASSTVIIGDTTEEIEIGKNLSLKTISITGGINSLARLKQAQPDVLVHSMAGIVRAIKEMNDG